MEQSIESMIEQAQASLPPIPPRMSKEEYRAIKQEEKQTVLDIRSKALEQAFSDKPSFMAYLDKQALFPDKSADNTLLILAQMPNATIVKSFDEWGKDELDAKGSIIRPRRSIRTDEKGICILDPRPYTVERDGVTTTATGFNVGRVFDVSQTVGGELPVTAHSPVSPDAYFSALVKNSRMRLVPNNEAAIAEHEALDPDKQYIRVTIDNDIPQEYGAVYDPDARAIWMRGDMDTAQSAVSLTRCLAADTLTNLGCNPDLHDIVLESKSAAYIVMKRFGMDAPMDDVNEQDMLAYEPEPSNLNAALDRIRKTSNIMTDRIGVSLGAVAKATPTREGR